MNNSLRCKYINKTPCSLAKIPKFQIIIKVEQRAARWRTIWIISQTHQLHQDQIDQATSNNNQIRNNKIIRNRKCQHKSRTSKYIKITLITSCKRLHNMEISRIYIEVNKIRLLMDLFSIQIHTEMLWEKLGRLILFKQMT